MLVTLALCAPTAIPAIAGDDGTGSAIATAGRVADRPPATPRLEVAENGRYLVRDGEPFWWMGDTGWALFSQASEEDALRYLDVRRDQGFNVIQAVALFPHAGQRPVDDVDDAAGASQYWEAMERVIIAAAELDMYVAVLPVWGDTQTGSVVTEDTAADYGAFLGDRFAEMDNIVWVMGGDHPADGEEQLWANLADGLDSAGADQLTTYHPRGDQTSAQWFADADWLDFHMIQGGHCLRYESRADLLATTYDAEPAKPFLDGEPIYEDHPYCWEPAEGYSTALDVRRDAYWAAMSGAAGHTYGHHAVWQFLDEGGAAVMGARGSWTEGISDPGAQQMRHLRALMESRPVHRARPEASALVTDPGSGEGQIRAIGAGDGSFVMIYAGSGQTFEVDLDAVSGDDRVGYWFNPRTGRSAPTDVGDGRFRTPDEQDWVLVVDDAEAGFGAPGARRDRTTDRSDAPDDDAPARRGSR